MPNAGPQEWVGLSFQKGDKVRTAIQINKRDYSEEGRLARKPNMVGTITDLSNSHGLCFRVEYDDGDFGYFDPDELTQWPPTRYDLIREEASP